MGCVAASVNKHQKLQRRNPMQESTFTNYDQLPLFLNANTVAQVLGVSISSAYELMHETGFPALRIGSRIVVPKEKFCRWVDVQTGGDA